MVSTDQVPVVPSEQAPVTGQETPRRRRFGRRRVIAIVAVVALAGAGVGVWLGTRGSSATPALSVTNEVVTVTTGTIEETVATSGTLEPASQASLNFAVSGKVTAVDVSTGQKVTKGQTLATVGPAALQDQVDAAQASLSSAQAALSSDQADSAVASQIDSDEAAVTSAQTQLSTAQTDLSDAALTSTITGTVASVDLSVGQEVSGTGSGDSGSSAASAGDSGDSGSTAQVVVIGTDSYSVSSTVDDTQVGEIKVGEQADITPGSSTTPVYGVVSSVGLIASDTSGVATFPVTIAVTGTPAGLYAGSTATVSIITKDLSDVVEVPTAAISYSGGNSTVTEVEGSRHVSQVVTTGATANGETQIVSGLRAGDKVLEREVKFNITSGGGARSLFGGTGGATKQFRGGFPGGATFIGGSGGAPAGATFSNTGGVGG